MPYDHNLNGDRCGGSSLWAKAEGLYPACYADYWGHTTLLAARVLRRINRSAM